MSNFKTQVIRNLKPYSKYVEELNKPALRNIIQVCVHFIEARNYSSEIYEKAKIKLTSSGDFPEHYDELFSAVFQLFQAFLRQKEMIKEDELKSILRELKFQDECIQDLNKVIFQHRESLSHNLYEMKALQTPTKGLSFRINISLCDSGTSKLINQPTILVSVINKNELRTLEIPLSIFHRLRYKVALLLKEIQTLEDRQIMKK